MPNRASEVQWSPQAEPPTARDRLVDAALAIADEDGLDDVSIRRVASRIGMRPMSVYSHVASKDDLIALMFERVSAELLLSEPISDAGAEQLRRIANRAFETYLAHPWMLHAFGRRPAPGPNQLLRAEQSAQAVAAFGIEPERAWIALSIVHEWTLGHALHVVTLREDAALREQLDTADDTHHPNALRALALRQDPDLQRSFDEGLEAVLAGIAARFRAPAHR